jgi:tetratricopeptide (TPR) repeat protein
VYSDDVPTVSRLAQMLGVRYQPKVEQDDLTVEEIWQMYLHHGLYQHAARLLEQEIAAADTGQRRIELMSERTSALQNAGDKDAARRAALEYEKALQDAITQSPARAELHWRLGRLYYSGAYGRDYQKAFDALTNARNLDPQYDPGGLQAIECLYKQGQYKEAWSAMSAAVRSGRPEVFREPMLYYAALAAQQGGAAQDAAPLLRLALYRFPTNALAAQAREMTGEVMHESKP